MKPCRYCKEDINLHVLEYWPWKWDSRPSGYYVQCGSCKARGPVWEHQQGAIILWDGDKTIIREDKKKAA